MALMEAIADGQVRVETLREELGKVRHALDNTDAVLGVADNSLELAEEVIEEARKVLPVIIAVGVAITATAVTVYLLRKRNNHRHDQQST